MTILKIILRWLLFIAAIALVALGCSYVPAITINRPTFTAGQVMLYSFSLAFVWVEILRWGNRKPFTCMKCMVGWFALLLAVLSGVDHWYMFPAIGVTIGGIFEAIKMKL